MNIDGTDPVRLSGRGLESSPAFSPDGKWIIYTSLSSNKNTLWKVPVGGGEEQQITEIFAAVPAVSPDGKLIACFYWIEQPGQPIQVAIIPFEGGQPLKTFNISPTQVRWTPDGRGLAYADNRGGAANIWVQPIDGGPPKQLTRFKTDQILSFAWSHDGKQMACARGVINNDVVLISNRP
jgi:Tol biopolymer transport system component